MSAADRKKIDEAVLAVVKSISEEGGGPMPVNAIATLASIFLKDLNRVVDALEKSWGTKR